MLVQLAMQIFEEWTGIRAEEAVFQRAVAEALGESNPAKCGISAVRPAGG
jgi:hypothetical protein